ncbi:carboxymuconolactone decarboxylase [Occultella glacieicola]|uniref:Carboxymuconolactone decarboxylase n=1 Tax=Occultella glacieicola TaxID=2518684 RepID=A0ABY2DXE2_9MICO|nr:carboxymuconolactone decarboxylase family protein [Occultella glacieicola]TDE88804.1 carboxymuconolactone decarboxylase [Occultella glacieicola]
MTPTDLRDELAGTDPDLLAITQPFALEVQRDAPLPTTTRAIVELGALIAVGAWRHLRLRLAQALHDGVPAVVIKEVTYQAVPYVGLGRAHEAVAVVNEVLLAHDVTLPLPGQATTTAADRAELGLRVQKRLVGDDAVDAMYAGAPADTAHIQRYLSAHCFGDHYTRDGIGLPDRELLTLAILVALGGADPQVAAHVRANLRVGNDRALMIAVLTQLLPLVGYPRALNALRALDQVAPATGTEET